MEGKVIAMKSGGVNNDGGHRYDGWPGENKVARCLEKRKGSRSHLSFYSSQA